jgi:hypothetical protein
MVVGWAFPSATWIARIPMSASRAACYSPREQFREPFVTILGDELYLASNHRRLMDDLPPDFDAVCGLLRTVDLHQIKRNYSVRVEEGRITHLVEKTRDDRKRVFADRPGAEPKRART